MSLTDNRYPSFVKMLTFLLVLPAMLILAGCENGNNSSGTNGVEFHNQSSHDVTLATSWVKEPTSPGVVTTRHLAPGDSVLVEPTLSDTVYYSYQPTDTITAESIEQDVVVFRDR